MDAPTEFKDFHQIFQNLIRKYDASVVYDDFMDYIIHGFSLEQGLAWNMQYNYDENLLFSNMYVEYVKVMNQKIGVEGLPWYDFFGTYYEAEIINKSNRKDAGQFFTPPNISDLMAHLIKEPQNQKGVITDPTAGSGRNLLSYNHLHPGMWMIAQDLDLTCVKMCICNFMFHGIRGEVYWMDSLSMKVFDAWFVNGALSATHGVPHVMKMDLDEVKPVKAEKQASLSIFGNE